MVRDGEPPSFPSVVREAEPCPESVVRDGEPPAFTSVVRDKPTHSLVHSTCPCDPSMPT